MLYEKYTTGTASCIGGVVTVNGNLTTWLASKMCVGSRIAFGTTDPSTVAPGDWYQIASVVNDTQLTLTVNGPNTGGLVPYVIEDLKALVLTTNATLANGGLFMAKGLRIEDFSVGGTTIPAAVATDDIKAVYWLADAAVVTHTIGGGIGMEPMTNWTTQYVYGTHLPAVTTPRVFKYNVRVALAGLAAGKSVSAYVLQTGNQAVTGNVSQVNNLRCDILNHGPGSGIRSLYYVTTTRIYRADCANITMGNVVWNSDSMTEVPPGGVTTFAATGALNTIEISNTLDRLIVVTTSAAGTRSYVTIYRTDGGQMDYIFALDNKQIQQAGADAGLTFFPNTNSQAFCMWVEDGIACMITNGTTAVTNFMYFWPLGVHWDFASGGGVAANQQRLITPAMTATNAIRFYRVMFCRERVLGSDKLGLAPDASRLYYRTAGIATDVGAWTLVDETGDISGAGSSDEIQFMFEFSIIGRFSVPSRIFSIAVVYETDDDTDSHYEPSVSESVVASNMFAWRQKTAWGTNIPDMRIQIFNVVGGATVLDDTVLASAFGTWEYSTDGVVWLAWDDTQDVVGYYIRYTATTLPAGIVVRVLLTQA